ncbi:MAG: TetR/AcrR family transcriptional regulator [Acidimicrobiales bacterium]|nr:TetR/AcrR family transcriptional regulator [Acidimicrobiales bacterium]
MPDDVEPNADADESARAADGRVPGARGQATRQRLLDVTAELLAVGAYRDLRVVDIARAAETSPATFYQYFGDVEAAVLVLAAQLAETGAAELTELVTSGDWQAEPEVAARTLADGVLRFFARHAALIRVLDLAVLEGDDRFRDLRTWLLNGLTSELERVVAAALEPSGLSPKAVAGVATSSLVHVAAHQSGLEQWGVTRDELVDALAAPIADLMARR